MIAKIIQRITLIFTLVAAAGLLLLILMASNPKAFWNVAGEIHDDVFSALHALGVGIVIIFFVFVILGVATWVVKLRQEQGLIRPGKYGPVQAVRHQGNIVQLASPNEVRGMDPLQQIAYAQKLLQLAAVANAKVQKVTMDDEPQKQIAAPEGIPPIVRYEDVADEVPDDMSLLGIHPDSGDLELTDWEKLKMVWLVGSSSTGKSNTIFGKALEAKNKGAKLAVVDQHYTKPDSLGKKLAPLSASFLRPIAITDKEVTATLAWFKAEFERRVKCPICARGKQCAACSQKVVLICDEMNRMVRNDELKKPLQEIVAICGEESRGFGMYGWFLSQKCAGMKWLRDSAITVIVHRLTRFEEAKLACNEDTAAARKLLTFKVGRTYIYGVDFDEPVELQQPLYDANIVDGSISAPVSDDISQPSPVDDDEDTPGDIGGKQLETENTVELSQAQKMKLLQVLDMDAQQKGQNDIIRTIWGVEPNTRAGQAAAEELRAIRAYIAQEQRKQLGV